MSIFMELVIGIMIGAVILVIINEAKLPRTQHCEIIKTAEVVK